MDLKQLRCFLKAAELLNFTRAAEALRLAQPALSRQIQSLEAELGVALLERSPRRVILTPAGAGLADDVREIFELVEAAEARVKRLHRAGKTVLNIGIAPGLVGEILPALMRGLERQRLRLRLNIRDLFNAEMVAGVRDRSLDLALLPLHAVPRNPAFVTLPIDSRLLEVIVPAGHPLATRRSVALREIAAETLLAYERREYPDYHRLLDRLSAQTKTPLVVAAEFDGGSSLVAAVQSGAGVAIVSSHFRQLPEGVVRRPIGGIREKLGVALLHHRDLTPKLAAALHKACAAVAGGDWDTA
ncbi:MAG: LysR family transcriptional regulator [Opitutaceae bacterium]